MPNMKSEKLLGAIMNKLKEYKANPLPSPVEEKKRQKNLMKMFCIYTSLKKKEKARQRLEQSDATIHEENTKPQMQRQEEEQVNTIHSENIETQSQRQEEHVNTSHSEKVETQSQRQEEHVNTIHSENVETQSQEQEQLDTAIQEEDAMTRLSDLDNCKNTETQIQRPEKNVCTIKTFVHEEENVKRQSQSQEQCDAVIQEEENTDTHLSDFDSYNQGSNSDPHENDRISLNNSPENVVNETKSENEMSVIYISDESEPEELTNDCSPANQENIKKRVFDETEETFNESIEEHEHSINQFLIQLSERLKKLPYRQRSKLEIEFFKRLIEVEECLAFYNN